MGFKLIPFLIGVALVYLKYKHWILISNWLIALCFFIWFVMLYYSIHKKNKELNTPRPVYLTNSTY